MAQLFEPIGRANAGNHMTNRGLPLRNDGRWRWRLAFAHLGIGGNAEESKHRGRC